jgi:sulfite exporter TauE/SafE
VIPLIAAVFMASVLGSLHCAGMCGAFLAFAVGADADPGMPLPSRARLQAAYHAGRFVTYATLGAVAGALGAALNLGGSMVGIQRAAAALAGALMIGFGLIAVLRISGVRLPRAPVPAPMRALLTRGHRWAFGMPPARRALVIGLLTTLLPCGWLYAFVITSAGTASPALGAVTMAVFWLGTLPVMIALGTGLQALTGALRRRIPLITSLSVVAVGILTVAGRLAMPDLGRNYSVIPTGLKAATDHAHSLEKTVPSCCAEK